MAHHRRMLHLLVATLGLACSGDGGEQPRPPETAGTAAPTATARCYRSPSSVLFGPRTPSGQQGRGPGWLRLDGLAATADSGTARIIDADGKAMAARWRRAAGDSVAVLAADDFLRVELSLGLSDTLATGRATAHSDAAAERDSAGRLVDLRRAWVLSARSAPCDSMPQPPSVG